MAENQAGEKVRIDQTLPSELESVDAAEETVVGIATEAGFPEDELHRIGMAVREAMVNAVVHGNRYSARKKVRLKVLEGPGRIEITIGDEGEGFEMETVPDPLSEENLLRHSGRGLLLIQAFMDAVDVRKTGTSGTEITMVKRLSASGG
jgi:serine/threonine-protein kinase RsbW